MRARGGGCGGEECTIGAGPRREEVGAKILDRDTPLSRPRNAMRELYRYPAGSTGLRDRRLRHARGGRELALAATELDGS